MGRVGLFRNEFRGFNFVKHQTGVAKTCSNKKPEQEAQFAQIVKTGVSIFIIYQANAAQCKWMTKGYKGLTFNQSAVCKLIWDELSSRQHGSSILLSTGPSLCHLNVAKGFCSVPLTGSSAAFYSMCRF